MDFRKGDLRLYSFERLCPFKLSRCHFFCKSGLHWQYIWSIILYDFLAVNGFCTTILVSILYFSLLLSISNVKSIHISLNIHNPRVYFTIPLSLFSFASNTAL